MRTYAEAGVDLNKSSAFVSELTKQLTFTRNANTARFKGHYTGLINFGEYYITLNTDGVGTKMLIAEELQKFDTVGIDCVAMNVNDTISVGAEPIAMVDYLAINRYNVSIAAQIGQGLNIGAKLANIDIIGGETAVIPEMLRAIDLSGTVVGIIKKEKLIDGMTITDGDLIVGLESSGLHSNGFTLVRKLLKQHNVKYTEKLGTKTLGSVLLEPTRIYVKYILELLKIAEIHGLAHITGSGVRNLLRLKKKKYILDYLIKPAPIFQFIQTLGNITDREMYQTFNMGMGFAIIVPERDVDTVLNYLKHKIKAKIVGFVAPGASIVIPPLKINYDRY